MISYYFKTIRDKYPKTLDRFKAGTWVYVENPSKKELENLSKEFGLEEGHLIDAIDPFEVPRHEREGDKTYVYTRIPSEEGGQIVTFSVLTVIGSEFVMTIAPKPLPFLKKFTEGNISFSTTQKTKLFIQLFSEYNDLYSKYLTSLRKHVSHISVKLDRIENKDIMQFVSYERVLNDFLAALVPTRALLETLLSGKSIRLYATDQDLIEDLFHNIGQFIELSRATVKNIVNIREAYSTIMTNSLNRVVKLFTSLTVLISIPTMIYSFYGMNVKLPYETAPLAFVGIVGITLLVSFLLLIVFIRKNWL